MIKLLKRVNWSLAGAIFVLCLILFTILIKTQIIPPLHQPWESNPDDWYVERIDTVGWEREVSYFAVITRLYREDGQAVIDTTHYEPRPSWFGDPAYNTKREHHDSLITWKPITQPIYKQKIHGWTEEEFKMLKTLIQKEGDNETKD